MSLERDPRVPEQTQVRQEQPWSSAGGSATSMDITAAHRSSVSRASLGYCSSHAGCECPQLVPSQGWCHPVHASAPSSPCLTHALLSFVTRNQRHSGLRGQSSLHAPKVMTEDQGSSLLATVLLAQFAQFAIPPPWLTQAPSRVLPKSLCWLCCFPWCLCVPLTSDAHHTQHKLRIQKSNKCRFGDTKTCSARWKLGDW